MLFLSRSACFLLLLPPISQIMLGQDRPGPDAPPLMPWPAHVTVASQNPGESLEISTGFNMALTGSGASDDRVKAEAIRTFGRLQRQTGVRTLPNLVSENEHPSLVVEINGRDHKAPQKLGDEESYRLSVAGGKARLTAASPLGAIRGFNTFLQLVRQDPVATSNPGAASATLGFSVPAVTIDDHPRFPWRGLSLDVSRHFLPASDVLRTLDGMAAVKLNVLHWHLSDDQGFRIESRKFPRLQQAGSEGMFYTQAEVREVIAHARLRGIRVVPEFDMPGHAKSWMAAYPKLSSGEGPYEVDKGFGIIAEAMDPTLESTYRFLDGFIGEMSKLFPDEYFHIGGDEVDARAWAHSTHIRDFMRKKKIADAKALQVYFNQRLLKIVTKHGKQMEGWDEVLQPGLPKEVVIQSWRGQESLWHAAAEGYRGLLSAGYYLDLMQPASQHYAVDPLVLPQSARDRLQKRGEPMPPPPSGSQVQNILGGEAAMWEELATSENIDSRLWPRLAAIAERFWSAQEVNDTESMYARLAVADHWLEWLGLNQNTNLRLMRQRLAGGEESFGLETLAALVEPVKGYARGARKYQTITPLNRLVDAVHPESDMARQFNLDVDRYLGGDASLRDSLRVRLAAWGAASRTVLPVLQQHALLLENVPLAQALDEVCTMGDAALAGGPEPNDANTRLDELAKRKGDLLLPIVAGVRRLVSAPH